MQDNREYKITSRQGSRGGAVGDPICHSGARRGYRCGTITNPSTSVKVQPSGYTLKDMREDDICAGPGDSGGPVYSNNRAHGIISASRVKLNNDGSYRCLDEPRTWYSGMYNVEQALGVTVVTK